MQLAENLAVLSCPECGLVLQTLDLPCPACAARDTSPLLDADLQTLHKHSKTFRTRHLVRPRPDAFVAEVNSWLAGEPGIVGVSATLPRDHHGIVKGMTLTCLASSRDPEYRFRFDRINLLGRLSLRSRDVGEVLNAWAERHPERVHVGHQVLARMGQPTEMWLLSKGPRDDVGEPARSPRFRIGIWLHRLVALAAFIAGCALVAGIGAVTHTGEFVDGGALLGGFVAAGLMFRRWGRPRR